MHSPRFGFSISPGEAAGVSHEVAGAEALGYDRVGIWDSPALFRDPWVVLAACAQSTQRIALGTWVTNPLSRHPVVTASAAASLDDLAPGRVYLGIGSGGTGVLHLGMKAAPLAVLERYVQAVRRLLEQGETDYDGNTVRLQWAKRRIPIIMAAHGPGSLRLAGRVADGVICGLGVTPEVIRGCLALIEEGAHAAGRQLEDLDIWFTCFWFVDEKPGVAAAQGAWAATSFASHFARGGVEGKFVPDDYKEAFREVGSRYDYVTHGAVPAEQKARYAALMQELGIADYMRQRFAFCGTPAEVHARVQAAIAAGARNFDGAIDADLPEHSQRISNWARLVLHPYFGR